MTELRHFGNYSFSMLNSKGDQIYKCKFLTRIMYTDRRMLKYVFEIKIIHLYKITLLKKKKASFLYEKPYFRRGLRTQNWAF